MRIFDSMTARLLDACRSFSSIIILLTAVDIAINSTATMHLRYIVTHSRFVQTLTQNCRSYR